MNFSEVPDILNTIFKSFIRLHLDHGVFFMIKPLMSHFTRILTLFNISSHSNNWGKRGLSSEKLFIRFIIFKIKRLLKTVMFAL